MEESSESRDRLSELPDSVILHILSSLPMTDVVFTALLSKRWQNLWKTIPYLNFTHHIYDKDLAETRNFVNRALMFWKGTKILKFNIDFNSFEKSLSGDVDLWVLFAKENEVEELCIHLSCEPDAGSYGCPASDEVMKNSKESIYWAPLCLSSCSSIRKLSLVWCNLQIDRSPHWDRLKSLEIVGFCLSEDAIDKILSGAPQLEVFILRLMERYDYENLNIRSSSLKQLMIHKYYEDYASIVTTLRICCPNLETLKISGAPHKKCLLTNVSSLTDVTLGLFRARCPYSLSMHEILGEMLRQIFPTIQHVEKVTLSYHCFEVLAAMEKTYLHSLLSNVKFLELGVSSIKLDEMVDLLGILPKLNTLVVGQTCYGLEIDAENYLKSKTNNLPKSFLLQLRTVEITLDFSSKTSLSSSETSIFIFVEFLLKHASMLEKMVIRAEGIMSLPPESLFLVAEKLLSMPRSSPTAKVILCNASSFFNML